MATLTVYLLDREQLQWARLYRDGATETGRPYRTPPGLMNQTVFTAALTGSLTRPAGTTILNALQLGPDPGQILTDHAFCYPPADPTRPTVLEPLYPIGSLRTSWP